MSGNAAIEARFVRVDDEGRLVLDIDGEQAVLNVNDTLLRGVEEARRRQDEAKEATGRSIPISTIQTLVRQGTSIAAIARDYGISASQVSRFAQPILVERKMAIEQFLSLPAPRPAAEGGSPKARKGAATHSIGELVNERFGADGPNKATVEWTASRKPRQPWHITAIIRTPSRTLNAMWLWSVADGTINAVNPTATWIFEGADTTFDHVPPILSDELPGIMRDAADTVIAQDAQMLGDFDGRAHGPSARTEAGADEVGRGAERHAAIARSGSNGSAPAGGDPTDEHHDIAINERSHGETARRSGANQAADATQPAASNPSETHPSGPAGDNATTSAPQRDRAANAPNPAGDSTGAANAADEEGTGAPARRRTRRTAVPSWDEIMFGEGAAS